MKLRIKALLTALLVLVAIGLLVFGIMRSTGYDAPSKPATTVADLQKRLNKNAAESTTQDRTTTRTAISDTPAAAAQNNQALPGTGPADTLLIFMSVSVFAAAIHMATTRSYKLRV